ncbi:hypothetical protein ACTWQL_11965 [Pseudalkalibacillus sp. R45]|uniref:hypothetical protein n=1 Tax=Pseudalkalibacillus sp. R45 TaxID=3457433 RepID=UPI003FCE9F76
MPSHWSEEEQIHLLNSVPTYRKIIRKDSKEAKRLLEKLAHEIHQQNPILHKRTENAIMERLPY